MARWNAGFINSLKLIKEIDSTKHVLKHFFDKKNYQPESKEEQKEFDEFSFISSTMALLIHVAKSDGLVVPSEKKQIINQLIFQLEQRFYEFEALAEKFGDTERQIVENIFDIILQSYEENDIDLLHTIEVINMIYQNNPHKKYLILRLCAFVAYADNEIDHLEMREMQNIAKHLNIDDAKLNKIIEEVKTEEQN